MRHTAGNQALYYLLVWPTAQLSVDPVLAAPSVGVAGHGRAGRRLPASAGASAADGWGCSPAGGLALSWGLARYSVEARSYTLAMLLVSITWLALVAAVQADTDDERAAGGVSTSSSPCWCPFAHGLATLEPRRPAGRAVPSCPVTKAGGISAGRCGWCRSWRSSWACCSPSGPARSATGFRRSASGRSIGVKQLMLGWGITGIVLFAAGGGSGRAHRAPVGSWPTAAEMHGCGCCPPSGLVGPPVMLLVLSLFRPYMSSRYVFASIPAFFLLAAGLVDRLGSVRRIAPASVVVGALLLVDQTHVTEPASRTGRRSPPASPTTPSPATASSRPPHTAPRSTTTGPTIPSSPRSSRCRRPSRSASSEGSTTRRSTTTRIWPRSSSTTPAARSG